MNRALRLVQVCSRRGVRSIARSRFHRTSNDWSDDAKEVAEHDFASTALSESRQERQLFGMDLDESKRLKIHEHSKTDVIGDEPRKSPRPVNTFRQVTYDEGELANSDLNMPPSPSNPHPFDPESLPPTHTRTLANLVNHYEMLQNLVELGMDLFSVELRTKMAPTLAKLNWERDVAPRLRLLLKIGMDMTELGDYLTRNPFILIQEMQDLVARINYLESKRFTKSEVLRIATKSRYWLNNDVKIIDGRLGWLQQQFELSGSQLRQLIVMEPRLIAFGTGPLQRLCQTFHDELGFSGQEMKQMLMKDPRLWMTNREEILKSHAYLMFQMGFSNRRIAMSPLALRTPKWALKRRHEFLKKLKRDQYDPEKAHYVSLDLLLHPSDSEFCTRAAGSSIAVYNHYLKTC
uniref:Uncharacterized protein n=1 Tax=Plectus sambesii TaxID=2011161 RepID=A0A914WHN7_9BILA